MALADHAELKEKAQRGARNHFVGSGTWLSSVFQSHFVALFGGAAPSTAVVPDNTTTGSISAACRPPILSSAGTYYLAESEIGHGSATTSQLRATYLLVDRLSHQGGLSGIVATEQTTNLPTAALTRNTSGEGVMIGLQCYTTLGATAVTATARYTNTAGTGGRTTQAIAVPSSLAAGRVLVFPLQDGDTGVKSVEGVTLSASTLTAGNFGIVLFKPLGFLAIDSAAVVDRTAIKDHFLQGGGLVPVPTDGCLDIFGVASAAPAGGQLFGSLNLIKG